MRTQRPPRLSFAFFIGTAVMFIFVELYQCLSTELQPDKVIGGSTIEMFLYIPLIFSSLSGLLVYLVSAWQTRHRHWDPYRFSMFQYRFFVLSRHEWDRLIASLGDLGFARKMDSTESEWTVVRYERPLPEERFQVRGTPEAPNQQVLRLAESDSGDGQQMRVIVEAFAQTPLKRLYHFDVDNRSFQLLEEIIDRFGLTQALCNDRWERIDRQWRPVV